MRLITLSLVLLSVVQWFPFVHTASEIDNLQVYYEGAVQKWRKRVCSICLQLFDDRQADVDIDDAAKDQLLSNIARLQELSLEPTGVDICTVLARGEMLLRVEKNLEEARRQLQAKGYSTESEQQKMYIRKQTMMTGKIEPLIRKQVCTDEDRPRPRKNSVRGPNTPRGSSGTKRQPKRKPSGGDDAGTGFKPSKGKGPKRRKKGSSMLASTENVVQQGASPNDANSPSVLDNLWSRMTSLPSVAAGYFPSPVGDGDRGRGRGRDRDRSRGGGVGMSLSRGGGGRRPVPGLGLGR